MRIIHMAAAAAVILMATPAAARVTTLTLTGRATGGDNGHLTAPAPFGTLQTSVNPVTGDTGGFVVERAFTLTLTVDDTLGELDAFPDGDSRYGGGADSPARGVFSMNGFSYELGGAFSIFSKGFSSTPDLLNGLLQEARMRPPMFGDFLQVNGQLDFDLQIPDLFSERRFSEPVDWTRAPGDIARGSLTLAIQDTSGSPLAFVEGPIRTADLDLTFDTLHIAAVPEPSTWAVMILGFGFVGAVLRRRRTAGAAA